MSKELEAFIEYLIVVKGLNPKTIKAYEADIKEMEEFLKKPAISFESEDVFSYLVTIEKATTRNRKLSALNSFFNFCLKQDYTNDKPNIPLAKLPKTLPKYILFEELKEKLKVCDKSSWIGQRDFAFILFLYSSGARVSEALSVTNADIFEDGWVKFTNTKRDKERIVPLANIVLKEIKKYQDMINFDSPYIWLNYQGKKLSRISAFKIVKKYLNTSPHTLRHSFATELVLGGADLRVVQEFLGHSSLTTTGIYTHIENKHLKDTINKYHPLAKEDSERYDKTVIN